MSLAVFVFEDLTHQVLPQVPEKPPQAVEEARSQADASLMKRLQDVKLLFISLRRWLIQSSAL